MPDESTRFDPVELTRRAFAAADAGDVDSVMSFVSPDSVWDASRWGFGTYEGRRRIRGFLEDWMGSFAEFRRASEEMVDLGNGVVYAVAVTMARSVGSRDQIRLRGATVCRWAESVAMQVTYYRDPDEGRADAEQLADSAG